MTTWQDHMTKTGSCDRHETRTWNKPKSWQMERTS